MDARANEVLEIRKSEDESRAQAAHYAAVAKQQEEQLQVQCSTVQNSIVSCSVV